MFLAETTKISTPEKGSQDVPESLSSAKSDIQVRQALNKKTKKKTKKLLYFTHFKWVFVRYYICFANIIRHR